MLYNLFFGDIIEAVMKNGKELNAFNIGLDLSGMVLSLTGIVGVIISRKIMKRNLILRYYDYANFCV